MMNSVHNIISFEKTSYRNKVSIYVFKYSGTKFRQQKVTKFLPMRFFLPTKFLPIKYAGNFNTSITEKEISKTQIYGVSASKL